MSRNRKDRKERRLSLGKDPVSMNRLEIADETADVKLRRKDNNQTFEKKGWEDLELYRGRSLELYCTSGCTAAYRIG